MILYKIIYTCNNDDYRWKHGFERGCKDIGGVYCREGWIWLKFIVIMCEILNEITKNKFSNFIRLGTYLSSQFYSKMRQKV